MIATVDREALRFASQGASCAAWYYPGSTGACVVMAGGAGVTKEPGTDRFAARFQQAGLSVLAFDHRHLGDSEGEPRQVVRIAEQLVDWRAAIAFARELGDVDEERVAIWGFSLGGGHVIRLGAMVPGLAAAIAQAPLADGRAAASNALRYTTPRALARLAGCGIADALGSRFGRSPLLIPLSGERGEVAAVTAPDAGDADRALNPANRYAEWRQEVAARFTLGVGFYRPVRDASRVLCPLLVVAYADDQTVLAAPAVRAGREAPRGESAELPGGHYAAFLEGHEATVDVELGFLRRHLLAEDAR
jgi:uncharacterized protein